MTVEELKASFRSVNDYPTPGVIFRDLTTVIKNPEAVAFIIDLMYDKYKDKGLTKIVGIESRGFIFAPILAYKLNIGFVPIRKKNKLPAEVVEESYMKEYGPDTIAVHKDALEKDDVVLLHDDLLATGGTMVAACKLLNKIGINNIMLDFVSELDALGGREALKGYGHIESIVHF